MEILSAHVGGGGGDPGPPSAATAIRDISGSAGGTQLPPALRENLRQDDPQEVTDRLQIREIRTYTPYRLKIGVDADKLYVFV